MVLQASGAISLGQIGTEFNNTNPISISEFYNPPVNVSASIPASGTISFSNFYSATNTWTTTFAEPPYTTTYLTSYTTSWSDPNQKGYNARTTSRYTVHTTYPASVTTTWTTTYTTYWIQGKDGSDYSRTTSRSTSRVTGVTTSVTTSWR